jgi:uncharacterized protein (DUF2141 family)
VLRRGLIIICCLLTAMAFSIAGATSGIYNIRVSVSGADSGEGQMIVALFDSPDSYLKEPLHEVIQTVNESGDAYLDLGSHQPGDYVVVVVYDKNSNGELDTGLFKIPVEKVGFSNNPKVRFGPPKWRNARFALTDADVDIDISMQRKSKSDY